MRDLLASPNYPDECIVTRDQLDDPDRSVSHMVQTAWDEITMPPHAHWGSGFPHGEEPDDRRRPALEDHDLQCSSDERVI